MNPQDIADRITQWREAFDGSFAAPALSPAQDLHDYLGIQVAGQALALPLDQLTGLLAWREPTPYPLPSDTLLGLIGHQGGALPLFDLRALLGHGRAAKPAWIVLLKSTPLALAFETFDSQWRLPPQDRILQSPSGDLLRGAVRCGDKLRPLVDLGALRQQLEAAHRPTTKE